MLLSTKGPSAMTSIDQVPPPQPRNNPHDTPQGHPAGTEFVNNRGSQTFFGGENVPQDRTDKDPDIDRKNKRGIKILGISVIAMVGVSAAAFLGTKAALSETPEDTRSNTSTSEEYIPETPSISNEVTSVPQLEASGNDIDTLSYQEANKLPESVLLDHFGPSLDEWRTDSYNYLLPYVSDSQKEFFNNNFPEDKRDYTPQQIANQVAIDLYDVSSQDGKSPDGIEAGRKMAAVVMAPENPEFSESIRRIGTTEAIEMINEVIETYPRLKDVTFRGHEIGSDGAEIMVIESNESGKKFFGLYQLLTTPEGNTTWQFTDIFAYNDLTINKDIAKAVGESR